MYLSINQRWTEHNCLPLLPATPFSFSSSHFYLPRFQASAPSPRRWCGASALMSTGLGFPYVLILELPGLKPPNSSPPWPARGDIFSTPRADPPHRYSVTPGRPDVTQGSIAPPSIDNLCVIDAPTIEFGTTRVCGTPHTTPTLVLAGGAYSDGFGALSAPRGGQTSQPRRRLDRRRVAHHRRAV